MRVLTVLLLLAGGGGLLFLRFRTLGPYDITVFPTSFHNTKIARIPLQLQNAAQVTICHMGDFHAKVEENVDRENAVHCLQNGRQWFNVSVATSYRHSLDLLCPSSRSLRFFSGDLMSGSEYDQLNDSPLSIARRLLRYWNISAITWGNHEFVDEWSRLSDIQANSVPSVNTNVIPLRGKQDRGAALINSTTGTLIFQIYNDHEHVYNLCVFGWAIHNLFQLGNPPVGYFNVTEYAESLDAALDSTALECVDICSSCKFPPLRILLSHAGYGSDIAAIRDTRLRKVQPTVHAILGGHTHSLSAFEGYPQDIEVTLQGENPVLSHTGAHGQWLGTIDFKLREDPNGILRWMVDRSTSQLHGIRGSAASESSAIKDALCAMDDSLLAPARARLLELARQRTAKIVTQRFPEERKSDSYSCRGSPCFMGEAIAQCIRLAGEDWLMHPPENIEGMTPLDSCLTHNISSGTSEARMRAILAQRLNVATKNKKLIFVAMEAAGDIRSKWPPPCDSPIMLLADGCNKPNVLTGFDIDRSLPFQSKMEIGELANGSALCRIIYRSQRSLWEAGNLRSDRKRRSSAYLHYSGMEAVINEDWMDRDAQNLQSFTSSLAIMGENLGISRTAEDNRNVFADSEFARVFFAQERTVGICSGTKEDDLKLVLADDKDVRLVVVGSDWIIKGGDGLIDVHRDWGCPVFSMGNMTVNDAAERWLDGVILRDIKGKSGYYVSSSP